MERNVTLDYFKLILSILVIIIHLPLLGNVTMTGIGSVDAILPTISSGIARIAVPCFFFINGYFLNVTDSRKFRSYLKKLILIYVVWSLFYLPFSFPIIQNVSSFIAVAFMGYFHLWYLSVLIGGCIIFYFVNKVISNKIVLFVLAIALYATGLFLEDTIPESTFSMFKYRNWLFTGFPYIAIGYLMRGMNEWISKKQLNVLFGLSLLLLLGELSLHLFAPAYYSNLRTSMILACPIFILYIARYGKRSTVKSDLMHLASGIYFIHPFILKTMSIDVPTIYGLPYIVIVSLLVSMLIIQANKSVKIFL